MNLTPPVKCSPCSGAAATGQPISTVRMFRPRSRAARSVSPTLPICGSVNTTAGAPRLSAQAEASIPRMWSPACRAWYLPWCVNSARPFTSPTAYSHPPPMPSTCRWSFTCNVPLRVDADRLQPDAFHDAGAPRRHEQFLRVQRLAVVHRHAHAAARAACRCHDAPEAEHDTLRLQRFDDCPQRERLEQRRVLGRPALQHSHLGCAERLPRLRHLQSDDAPADDDEALRYALRRRDLTARPRFGLDQPLDGRHEGQRSLLRAPRPCSPPVRRCCCRPPSRPRRASRRRAAPNRG